MDYLMCFIGVLAWVFLEMSATKNEDEKGFNLKRYVSEKWDDWVVSILGGLVFLWGSEAVVYLYFLFIKGAEKTVNLPNGYAVVAGFAGGIALYWIHKKYIKKLLKGEDF